MQIKTIADVDVVAIQQDDDVTVMVEFVAPSADAERIRPPAAVQIVLDCSGSMDGDRFSAAQHALVRLVDHLDPADQFGLVAFDDDVHVVIPAGPLTDKHAALEVIADLQAGGDANLSGGLFRGLQEARRAAGSGEATLLLISDGHANTGEVDPATLASIVAGARRHGITTTTVAIGTGCDETLLAGLAHGGQGNHMLVEEGDSVAAAVTGEIEGRLPKTVQAASLMISPDLEAVDSVSIWNHDVPNQPVETSVGTSVMAEFGDLWPGESRHLICSFDVPAIEELGLEQIAELELRYVALPDFDEQTVTIPIHVNVAPDDHTAGRIPSPGVHIEPVHQQVGDAKRRAADASRHGRRPAAPQTPDEARVPFAPTGART